MTKFTTKTPAHERAVKNRRGLEITYKNGCTVTVTNAVVKTITDNSQVWAENFIVARAAIDVAFEAALKVAKDKGMTRTEGGIVLAAILGADSISKVFPDDEKLSKSFKDKWQYFARDLLSNQGNKNDPNAKDKTLLTTEKVEVQASQDSLADTLVNDKVKFGAILATRLDMKSRIDVIRAMLADCTADEIEEVTNALLAPSLAAEQKSGATKVPPTRQTKTKGQAKLI